MQTIHQDQGNVQPERGERELLQLVSFRLSGEEYGIDILKVQEINRMLTITKVPNAPDFVEGIINLRGKVIPIINLRKRFGLEVKEVDKHTRIIVVNLDSRILGIVVDGVSEVLRLPSDTVQPAPPIVSGQGADYIRGIGKIGERLLILLDLNKLFSTEDREAIDRVVETNK